MDKILEILNTATGLLVKLLDFLSGHLARPPIRNLLSLTILAAILIVLYAFRHVIGFLLIRPFLSRTARQLTGLGVEMEEEPGTPKPYVLAVRLNLKERFRMALSDLGLYAHVDTDVLSAELIRRARYFSEDAEWCSGKDLPQRAAGMRDKSSMYLAMMRNVEQNRTARLTGRHDFHIDASILQELSLGDADFNPETGLELFGAGLFDARSYQTFRNLIRAFAIPGRAVRFRFSSREKRRAYAAHLQHAMINASAWVIYRRLTRWLGRLQFAQAVHFMKAGVSGDREASPVALNEGGLSVRYLSEDRGPAHYLRFEITSRSRGAIQRLRETGTLEIASFAAEEAESDGIVFEGIQPVSVSEPGTQAIASEAFRFENGYEREVFARYVNNAVLNQVEGLKDTEAAHDEVTK